LIPSFFDVGSLASPFHPPENGLNSLTEAWVLVGKLMRREETRGIIQASALNDSPP
jgi:hypothetical protein